jgi:geranylgeranyl pyrophosphate synthase
LKLFIADNLKEALKPEMAQLNQSLEDLARDSDGFLGDLMTYVLNGSGKRVRPALVYLSAQLGSADPEAVRTVEMAVELIHIATLIHDDVIDKSALRRGRQTVVNEQGVDTAVLLGDHIYTYAFQRVAELNIASLVQMMARSTSVMCSGEINQLKRRFQYDLTEDEYFSFIRMKTASLFGVSARSGAILAGQSVAIQEALESFAEHVGIAFQIKDDVLDLTGEEDVVGKTLRTDLLNGKMTLPLLHFRDSLANAASRDAFVADIRSPNGHMPEIIERMRAAGSLAYADSVSNHHVAQAQAHLDRVPAGRVRDLLAALAEMLLRRNA